MNGGRSLACRVQPRRAGDMIMMNIIWVVAVVLVALWLLGLATSYTAGGLIHVLLVLAIVAVLVRVLMGRRVA
jgi:hypothetical protein